MGIGKSTLEKEDKYVSYKSHLSAVSTVSTEGNRFQKEENFNILNKSSVIESEPFVQDSYSENSEDDLLTNTSTVLQGPNLSKKKKHVSKKKELKLTETATKFRLVQQKNIPTNTTKNQKDDKCDRNYHS